MKIKKKEIEQMIKEYEEIKLFNEFSIDKINNENLIIDNILRDLKYILSSVNNKKVSK